VEQFALPKMDKPIAGPEGTVAELGKGSPEGDLQAMVVLRTDGQAGLRIPREANQIAGAHLGAAEAVPPKLDKGAPAAALAI
jgi:hypothetical protein